MGRASRDTAQDCRSPHIAFRGFHCGHLSVNDLDRLGSSVRIGEVSSRPSAETDNEHSFESGDTGPRALAGPTGNPWSATADANHHWSGDRRPNSCLSGFHPGILRLVRPDGAERHSSSRLGGNRWCCRRSSSTRSISYVVAGDGKLDLAWPSYGTKSFLLERVCDTRQIFQFLDRRTMDVG